MIKKGIIGLFSNLGYEITKKASISNEAFNVDKEFRLIYDACAPFTMTSIERMFSLYNAVKYVAGNKIEGDFVECGVWKGGSSMLMAKTLNALNQPTRELYLYDTYEGMSEPTEKDVSINGRQVVENWENVKKDEKLFCYSSIDEVTRNINSTAYPESFIHFVKGKVEDTIPNVMPGKIALLRLDTDWFESTYHEMKYLYPKLEKGGVLIIDDYGHWQGAKEAIDKYFEEIGLIPLLNRIDYTGRIMVKL